MLNENNISRNLGLSPWDIVLVDFGKAGSSTHIQKGIRPAVVIGQPEIVSCKNTPVIQVIPLTSQSRYIPIHTAIENHEKYGLKLTSYVAPEQITTIDRHKILKKFGHVGKEDKLYQEIKTSVLRQLGFLKEER